MNPRHGTISSLVTAVDDELEAAEGQSSSDHGVSCKDSSLARSSSRLSVVCLRARGARQRALRRRLGRARRRARARRVRAARGVRPRRRALPDRAQGVRVAERLVRRCRAAVRSPGARGRLGGGLPARRRRRRRRHRLVIVSSSSSSLSSSSSSRRRLRGQTSVVVVVVVSAARPTSRASRARGHDRAGGETCERGRGGREAVLHARALAPPPARCLRGASCGDDFSSRR